MSAERIWHNTEQASEYSGYHPDTIAAALRSGELVGTQRKKNGRWRIHRDALDAWLRGDAA